MEAINTAIDTQGAGANIPLCQQRLTGPCWSCVLYSGLCQINWKSAAHLFGLCYLYCAGGAIKGLVQRILRGVKKAQIICAGKVEARPFLFLF